ncbi:tetratricopeptide repeat protein [Bradyrhizobium guangzhouense]|uniref:Tetratricopeptide repeat protein n=1 Tax=Bradyrhizobium guangzhouense TaxID=1325095 RepID=A0AAE5X1Q6_9BRAD|nr:tetratricopeptide repeat protein [Bradyrhizobium guangzhouense]QAU47221.1 hypothetical protein XH91_18935 [Bradyrhizobium guangzhouense]RXH13715.1 hypothetical protein EAS56_14055 [Bradyrhizobium guangzhouense]
MADDKLIDILIRESAGPLDVSKVLLAGTLLIAGFYALFRFFIEARIKATFDRELERTKALLDLQKQQLMKDFGLFAERKHELNREVYIQLRAAYRSLNKAIRAAYEHVDTNVLSPTGLDEYLAGLDVSLLDRKELVQLQEIAPDVVRMEIIRRTPRFRRERAERDMRIATEAVFTNELFLDGPVVAACNAVVSLAKQCVPAFDLEKREPCPALDQIPAALSRVRAAMRLSLLGEKDALDENGGYAEDPDDAFVSYMRNMEPPTIGGFVDFEDDLARLVSRGSVPEVRTNIERTRKVLLAAAGAEAVTSEQKLAKARALVELGRIDEAVALANLMLKDDSGDTRALPVICEGRLRKGENLKALEVIDRYVAAHPTDAEGWYMRGRANWGGFSDSAEDFRTALKYQPDHHKARAALANVYLRRGNTSGAIQEADQCLAEAPHDLTGQIVRLELLAEMHRWARLPVVCDQVLVIHPRQPLAIKLKGDALNILGRPVDAASFADGILSQTPDFPEALAVRARASFNRAEFEPALSDANAALARGPGNADAKLVRAEALFALKRWDEAIAAATEAYPFAKAFSREAGTILNLLQVSQRAKITVAADAATKSSPETAKELQ